MRLRFGKHRGKELSDVPPDYLYWLLNASRTLIVELEEELDEPHSTSGNGTHHSTPPNLPPLTKDLVEAGYRTLCKKFHPDLNNGRGHNKMLELNKAMEELRRVLR